MAEFTHCGICGSLSHDAWDGHLEDDIDSPEPAPDVSPVQQAQADYAAHVAAAYARLGL